MYIPLCYSNPPLLRMEILTRCSRGVIILHDKLLKFWQIILMYNRRYL
jgi:hypothetical protein